MADPRETVLGNTQATQPMPVIGETIVVMDMVYRCVSIQYMDTEEAQGPAEIRVRFKQIVAPKK